MGRYSFSLEDGRPLTDPLGKDLPDDEAALAAARRIARELARTNRNPGNLRVVVRDRENRNVGEASLTAARFAKYMAGHAIDNLSDTSATSAEQASRKKQLLEGPKEFRSIRAKSRKGPPK